MLSLHKHLYPFPQPHQAGNLNQKLGNPSSIQKVVALGQYCLAVLPDFGNCVL